MCISACAYLLLIGSTGISFVNTSDSFSVSDTRIGIAAAAPVSFVLNIVSSLFFSISFLFSPSLDSITKVKHYTDNIAITN